MSFQPGHVPWNTRKEGEEGCRRWPGHDTDYVVVRGNGKEMRRCHECLKQANRTAAKARHRDVRQAALNQYGRLCACCGESHEEFLCIDHVNNDGNKHREEIKGKSTSGGSAVTYRWLRDNGYPEGFQTLCHNCNYAKHAYGVCPHKQESSSE